MQYDHKKIEKKWQDRWEASGAHSVIEDSHKKKEYLLIEFPYPSGDGLHVGHVRSWTALDVVARKRRAEGKNVLYPIGWDAFGLPTENYAIKTGKDPRLVTQENTDNFRRQIKSVGISFDWSREINTTDPAYYKWTQWIFLKFFEKGLAYKAKTYINWCPKDKIGLANEEVVDGACERCGTLVEKREKEQWMMAITKYAQRLYDDLDGVDYIERAKTQQRNWIGPSEGAEIDFAIVGSSEKIKIFTTRPDTLFGATYMVLAPEHPIVKTLAEGASNKDEIHAYAIAARNKSEIERTAEGKEKTGVEIKGARAINPANKKEIPIFIADYVVGNYGTGAIMAVPAHDERDYQFAQKFNLPIEYVVLPKRIDEKNPHVPGKEVIFRKIIMAIVHNPKTNKYLALEVKNPKWTTFVIGGVEEGEKPLEAALREIREETGYTNLKLVRELGGPVYSEFYAEHKGVNRTAHNTTILFELVDESQEPLAEEESSKHSITWLDLEEITRERMAHAELDIVLERMKTGNDLYAGPGILVNSGEFDGMESADVKKKITEHVGGKMVTTFKLRDWVFSRQRYWGEPIPMIHCESCGWQPVPEKDLPVLLPEVEKYQPSDTGESPLSLMPEWFNTTCPKCSGPAKRETDVMPNWAGSSWYYLRYADAQNKQAFAAKEALDYWTPVDWYNGGMEHTVLHLLYSRFWHKFLFDLGLVPTSEPYMKRTSHGLILAEDGSKMSKSKGNTVSPDQIVETFGADSLRLYEMFVGPFDQPVSWSTASIIGVRRFLERAMSLKIGDAVLPEDAEILLNQTIKKVGEDIENLKMNTAVSSLMVLLNKLEEMPSVPKDAYNVFLQLLAPFAPHIVSELWESAGNTIDIARAPWPLFDETKLIASTATVAVQINGKVRGSVVVAQNATEEEVLTAAGANQNIVKWLPEGALQKGNSGVKVIYIPGKILSFVIRPGA